MSTGLWVAASGASAQAQHVDSIANNLANSDTNGFKKDLPTFKEYLATQEREAGTQEVPRGPIQDKDFYPLDSRDQTFVVVDGTYTNFKAGHFKVTHGPLDLAMDGPGFIEVGTPQGSRFTRQGSLQISAEGTIVTAEGFPVLSAQTGATAGEALTEQGLRPAPSLDGLTPVVGADLSRVINIRDRKGSISISETGEIFVGENKIAKLSLVEFKDLSKVQKQGGVMFENKLPGNAIGSKVTLVRQGMLETSNVNPVEEMTNLIKAHRSFEQDLKAMKTYGELLQREANDIGKL